MLPVIEAGGYLVDYLWDVGPVGSTGMGPAVITYTELQAWQLCTGLSLQPWEVVILRRLSADYMVEASKAEKPDCPAPFGSPKMEFDRDVVSRKVSNAFKAFLQAKR